MHLYMNCELLQGNPQRVKLKRRLSETFIRCFLKIMVPCTCKHLYFIVKSINMPTIIRQTQGFQQTTTFAKSFKNCRKFSVSKFVREISHFSKNKLSYNEAKFREKIFRVKKSANSATFVAATINSSKKSIRSSLLQ